MVRLGHDDLSVEDVVIGVVAAVDDEGEVDDKSSGIAVTVGAGIGLVGWHTVVCQEFGIALTVDNQASAVALHVGGDVEPSANEIEALILGVVQIQRYGIRQDRPVGVLGIVSAPV